MNNVRITAEEIVQKNDICVMFGVRWEDKEDKLIMKKFYKWWVRKKFRKKKHGKITNLFYGT